MKNSNLDQNKFSPNLFWQIKEGLKKDPDNQAKFLAIQIGVAIIIGFLTLAIFAPQIGEKLGTISVKKKTQSAYANNLGSTWYLAPEAGKPLSSQSIAQVSSENYIVDAEIKNHLDLLNSYRAQNGVGPLTPVRTLTDAAKWMANDLATRPDKVFDHTDSLGRDPFQRMADFGYNFNTYKGENLVVVTETGQAALDFLKSSPGHNTNMLRSEYTAVGIYRAYSPTSNYGWYWVQDFGGFIDTPVTYVVSQGSILGRVFKANNANGLPDAGERIIQVEGASCGAYYKLAGVNISYSGAANGSVVPVLCTPEPYFDTGLISTGNYTVWATAPAGWEVTGVWQADPSDPVWGVNPDRSVTGNLSNGVWKDLWFGLKITGQDSDNDGFADGIEWYIGTDRLDNCPDNVSDPAWPPDISNSRKVDIVDVGAFRPVYLSQVGDGKYNKRFDLDADGLINTIDVGAMRPYFNKTCN